MPVRFIYVTVCLAILLASLPGDLLAQRQIGVRWEVPDNVVQADRELELFHKLGISVLEVDRELPVPVWTKINELEFRVLASLPVRFPVTRTFSDPDSAFLESVRTFITHFSSHTSVEAIGLYRYGLSGDDRFTEALRPYVRQIRAIFPGKLYYLDARTEPTVSNDLFDFKIVSISSVSVDSKALDNAADSKTFIYYNPSGEHATFMTPVKKVFDEASTGNIPVFFDSPWLLEVLQIHPRFEEVLKMYTAGQELVFATPNETISPSSPHSPIVLVLILIWGIFGVIYSMTPIFRKSMSRYFTGHRFYVDDVMQRHIRTVGPAGILLLIHALLAGIAVYCVIHVQFSELGLEALSYYFRFSLLGGDFARSVVVGAIFLTLAIEIICLFWLMLTNAQMRLPAQAVNLYVWPLLINLYVATAMVTLLMAGSGSTVVSVLGLTFLLVLLSAFVITSLDAARFANNKHVYLLGTGVLYVALLAGLLIWLLNNSHLKDIYNLARRLS